MGFNLGYLYAATFGYLLGSIPFGLIIAHLAGQGDIRKIGSGNIGATNVLRTGHKGLAALTLVFDAAKAGIAAMIAGYLWGYNAALIAGAAAVIGHCFPIWLGFKGGKGVATYFGFLLAMDWRVALIAALVWFLTALTSRMSSLSALLACLAAPIAAYALGEQGLALTSALLSLMIYIRHKDNIKRIIAGQESKIGKKS